MPRWQPRVLPTEQTCSRCKITKPLDQFPMRCDRAEPLKRCRACNDEEQAQRAKDIEDNARGVRTCSTCNTTKPLTDFALRGKNRPDERHFRCRGCMAQLSDEHYKQNRAHEMKRAAEGKAALLASNAERICAGCKLALAPDLFSADARSRDGFKRVCVHCDRATRYGVTRAVVQLLWDFQDHKCRVCGEPQTLFGKNSICVDHDHNTGKVRGLLCSKCNVALGAVRDDPQILVGLIQYLVVTGTTPAPDADLAAWEAYLQTQEKTPLAGGLSQVQPPAESQ